MKLLVPLLPGLGDALTASPILRAAIAAGATVDVLTMLEPVAQYARALDGLRDVIQIPLLKGGVREILCTLSLRHRSYDATILPFPATRWQYAAAARALLAQRLYLHDYAGLSRIIASARNTTFVPLVGGHRIWENCRLAEAAGFPISDDLSYLIPASWKSAVRRDGCIAVHAGSMSYKGNEAKRWPLENFRAMIASQLEKGRQIRLFVGPDEGAHVNEFAAFSGSPNFELLALDLESAAQRLSECSLFVGNDSGIAHLAAGLGLPSVVLYGMTNPARLAPIGKVDALRPSACPPCHDEGLRAFSCVRDFGYRCIVADIPVHIVEWRIDQHLISPPETLQAAKNGPFALYGRRSGG